MQTTKQNCHSLREQGLSVRNSISQLFCCHARTIACIHGQDKQNKIRMKTEYWMHFLLQCQPLIVDQGFSDKGLFSDDIQTANVIDCR